MAVLEQDKLTEARSRLSSRGVVSWTKPQINAALQAIEDAFQSTGNVGPRSVKAHFSNAVEGVTPGVFTLAQKDSLFLIWCRMHIERGGFI